MAATRSRKEPRPDVRAIATRAERARPRTPQASPREQTAEKRRQAADEKRVREWLSASIDVGAIEQLARQREKLALQRGEASHRQAVAAASQRGKWLARQALNPLVLPPLDGSGLFTIDIAAWIRAWPNTGALRNSGTGPGNNWGKYRLDVTAGLLELPDEARLSFYALWQNRSEDAVTVRVATQLTANAYLRAHADGRYFGSLFISGASADATVRARLTVTPLWVPNTQFTVAEAPVGSVSARGGFTGDDDGKAIFTSTALDGALPVTVPAGRFLMLETSLVTGWKIDSGSIRVDAEQGAFRIDVPFWIVTVAG